MVQLGYRRRKSGSLISRWLEMRQLPSLPAFH
jgi:hypothetical protein